MLFPLWKSARDLELGHGATISSQSLGPITWDMSTPKDLATELAELVLVGFIISTAV
jgi:hypothetical protein